MSAIPARSANSLGSRTGRSNVPARRSRNLRKTLVPNSKKSTVFQPEWIRETSKVNLSPGSCKKCNVFRPIIEAIGRERASELRRARDGGAMFRFTLSGPCPEQRENH